MKKFFLCLWELPQNLLGMIYSRFAKSTNRFTYKNKKFVVYFCHCFGSAVSFGKYIIFDTKYKGSSKNKLWLMFKHEFGHSMQSLYLGWFYLLLVGVPSILRKIYSKIFKKSNKWYYSGYPEKWADRLGGVSRY